MLFVFLFKLSLQNGIKKSVRVPVLVLLSTCEGFLCLLCSRYFFRNNLRIRFWLSGMKLFSLVQWSPLEHLLVTTSCRLGNMLLAHLSWCSHQFVWVLLWPSAGFVWSGECSGATLSLLWCWTKSDLQKQCVKQQGHTELVTQIQTFTHSNTIVISTLYKLHIIKSTIIKGISCMCGIFLQS